MHRALRLLAAASAVSIAACDDPTELIATSAVVHDTLSVYALNDKDFTFPSALNIPELAVVRATGTFSFDIGFDIDQTGRVVLYPMALLASELANLPPGSLADLHPVGLQKVAVPFDELTRAPDTGYNPDSALVVLPSETIAVQVGAPRYCAFPFPQTIYAKLVVDSLQTATRRIFFRITVDPSCGFRSFLPGIPTD